MDGSLRIGIHTSIAGDLANALESARKLGCNALQIFSASPRMWPRAGTRIPEADAAKFRARREALALGPLVIQQPELLLTTKGMTIVGGVVLILIGIAVCASQGG